MQSLWAKIVALLMSVFVCFSSFPGVETLRVTCGLLFFPAYSNARTAAAGLPGLEEGFVPQGVTRLPEEDVYLVCGYMDDETSSRLYVLRGNDYTCISLRKENGEIYNGHAGGITAAGPYIYISNNKRLYVLEKETVLSAGNGDVLPFLGSVRVPCRASFCSSDGERVYVGEYHEDEGYETDPSHELTAPDGTVYKALVFGYTVSPEAPFGLLSDAPAAAFSTCDAVQGFAFLPDGTAVLSCTNSPYVSQLLFYGCADERDGYFSFDGTEIPLYYLTGARLSANVRMPRMSEDLEYGDGEILTVFESGARRFEPNGTYTEKSVVRLSAEALRSKGRPACLTRGAGAAD